MTDHAITRYQEKGKQKQTHGGECLWHDCPCTEYALKIIKGSNNDYALPHEQLETLIDCNYSIHSAKGQAPKKKPQEYLIQDADRKGRARNVNGNHPKRYNNGEYP